MGHKWPINESLTGFDHVPTVYLEVLSVWYKVFAFNPGFTSNDDGSLTTLSFFQNFDFTINFCDHRRIFWLAGFEDFRDSWQTACDVRNTTGVTRHLGEHGPGLNVITFLDHDHGAFREVLHIKSFAFLTAGVFNNDLWMEITLVINDHHPHVPTGFSFDTHRFAFNDVFETHLTWNLGKNRNGIGVPLTQHSSLFHFLAFLDSQSRPGRHRVGLDFTTAVIHDGNFTVSSQHNLLARRIFDRSHSGQANLTSLLRLDVRLNRLLAHATTDVEGTHGQLCAGLADTLGSNDANRHSFFDQSTGRHVHAVTTSTYTQWCITGHWRANLNFLKSHRLDLAGNLGRDHLILSHDDFVCDRIHNGLTTDTTVDRIDEADLHLLTAIDNTFRDSLRCEAVIHGDHHVLSHVSQFTGQVTTISSLECCICQTFPGTMGGTEVFQNRQAFTEVCLDRSFNDFTGWFGHQTTHAGQLADLLDTTTSTRVRHQEHGIDIPATFTDIIFHGVHHVLGDRFTSIGPLVQHMVVPFLSTHQTTIVVLLEFHDFLLSTLDEGCLRVRRDEVVCCERQTTSSRFTEAHLHHVIQQMDGCASAETLVTVTDCTGQIPTSHGLVVEIHAVRKHFIETNASRSRLNDGSINAGIVIGFQPLELGQTHFHFGMQGNDTLSKSEIQFVVTGKHHALSKLIGHINSGVVATHHDVLGRTHDRLTIGWCEHIVGAHHQSVGFDLCLNRERQVNCHLVTIEVRIETFADQRMQVDGVSFYQGRLKSLNPHAVQSWSTIQQHGMIGDYLLEDIPDFFVFPFQHFLGRFDGIGMTQLFESSNDERLVEFQCDFLWQPALMKFQSWTDNNHASSRIVDTFTEQILAETSLLPFDHVGQGFQWTI